MGDARARQSQLLPSSGNIVAPVGTAIHAVAGCAETESSCTGLTGNEWGPPPNHWQVDLFAGDFQVDG